MSAVYYISQLTKVNGKKQVMYSYITSAPCDQVLKAGDPRLTYLQGYTCPNVTNIDEFFIPLQTSPDILGFEPGYDFQLLVGLCSEFQSITK